MNCILLYHDPLLLHSLLLDGWHKQLSVLAIALELSECVHTVLVSPDLVDLLIAHSGHFKDFFEEFIFAHVL